MVALRSPAHPGATARAAVLGLALLLAAAVGAAPVGDAATAPSAAAATTAPCWGVPTDLDGGGPDVVVGLPSYDLPGKPDAGAVVVYSNVAAYGSADPRTPSRSTLLTADAFGLVPSAGDRFGAAVAAWPDAGSSDDADDCADLWVGIPGFASEGRAGAGRVALLHGSVNGLTGPALTLSEQSVSGGAQAGAAFGSALATDGRSTLVVGSPARDIGTAVDAGRVVRFDFAGATPPTATAIQQNTVAAPESGDRFGEVVELMPTGLGPVLVVGVPREDIGTKVDAGLVIMQPSVGPMSAVSQDSPGAAGAVEAGDRYGASVDGYFTFEVDHPVGFLAIGVPGEDLGTVADAGMVSFASYDLDFDHSQVLPLRGRPAALSQDSPGVPGGVEAGDQFGGAVLTGEFGTDNGWRQIVVSAPGEDLGSLADAGMLGMTRTGEDGSVSGSPQSSAWTQDSPGVPGAAEKGDRMGAAVESVLLTEAQDDDDLVWPVNLVTAPGEDLGTVADAGLALLGVAGRPAVALSPPVVQAGAGLGMSVMRQS